MERHRGDTTIFDSCALCLLRRLSFGEEHGVSSSLEGYEEPDCMVHPAMIAAFLKAQAAQDFGDVKGFAQKVHVEWQEGERGPLGNGEGFDWMNRNTIYTLLILSLINTAQSSGISA